MGSFELKGDALSFARLAGTMMACPAGMDTEREFLGALPRVTRWKIVGEHLELFDARGKVLARFEARALR
jgi:heat shock protein HslJ